MGVINTNISSLIGLNNIRLTNLGLQKTLEKLSSGLRINVGADDPSGLAIAKGMEAQIGGIRTAMQNGEDGISLIHTADGALAESHDILMRMRDLTVRAANEAVMTQADQQKLSDEFVRLKDELYRKSQAVTFNTKQIFTGTTYGYSIRASNGAYTDGSTYTFYDVSAWDSVVLQIGPDNGTYFRIMVSLPHMTLSGLNLTGKVKLSTTGSYIGGFGSTDSTGIYLGSVRERASLALKWLNWTDSAIRRVSEVRAALGIQERRLNHIIDDLKAEDINISAAKSRIYDADMAVEISEFTRLQILQQSGTAILAQANAQPQSILQLLR
ncbi:MAG: flagellin [bacterium]